MRKIPVLFSAPYLSNYLELMKDKKQDSYLWTAIGTWTEHDKLVDGSAIRKLLRVIGAKAGLEKRIYPHLFRHSRATYYANRITEQQLKVFFGWTGDSKMVSTYVHINLWNYIDNKNKYHFDVCQNRSENNLFKNKEVFHNG